MLSLVTVSPVITAFHRCCLSHHVFDQVNLWSAWVEIETAILQLQLVSPSLSYSIFFQFSSKVWVLISLFAFLLVSVIIFSASISAAIIIIIIIIYSLEFSHQRKLMVFHWRLSDSKSPQVSRTLLSILAVFNNAVVWWSPLGRQPPNLLGPLIIL